MKFLSFALLALSLNTFAQVTEPTGLSEVAPTLEKCDPEVNLLTLVQAPIKDFATTVSGDINVLALAHTSGDPAVWSLIHKVGITFPVDVDGMPDQACFTISNAYAKIKKVKSIGYDAKKGRLLEIPASIATYDMIKDEFGSKNVVLKVRINRTNGGSVTLEK